MKNHSGLTLIELVVTLAIASLLLALAVPSFMDTMANSKRASDVNTLVQALTFARTQAVSLNRPVSVCRSSDPLADTPACSGNGAWEDGWFVFIDTDADGTLDADDAGEDRDADGDTDEQDAILRAYESLRGDSTLRRNGANRSHVSFSRVGMANGTLGSFVYCDRRGFDESRFVIVSRGGRIRSDDSSGSISSCTP